MHFCIFFCFRITFRRTLQYINTQWCHIVKIVASFDLRSMQLCYEFTLMLEIEFQLKTIWHYSVSNNNVLKLTLDLSVLSKNYAWKFSLKITSFNVKFYDKYWNSLRDRRKRIGSFKSLFKDKNSSTSWKYKFLISRSSRYFIIRL